MTEPSATGSFDSGAAEFAQFAPLLWDPLGAAAVEVARPSPGERVLDVCCGAGSSAVPAAEAVGPGGLVDAIDLAAGLLERGVSRGRSLPQLRFHLADATRWTPPDGEPYDRLQCVFGVFFLPGMDDATRRLVGLLRPGGTMSVTTWCAGAMSRVAAPLIQALTEHRGAPLPEPSFGQQASRLDTEDKLAGWLQTTGLSDVRVSALGVDVALTPDSAWTFITGSAVRSLLDGLAREVVTSVRTRYLDLVDEVTALEARALTGVGVRPR